MTVAGKPSDPNLHKLVQRPVPSVGSKQVLVKVAAAALNPIDFKICEGKIAAGKLPLYTCFDFAGEVVEAGAESGFAKGQEVFGDVPNGKADDPVGGSLSEYILVPSQVISAKPQGMSASDAASMAMVGQTVLDCLAKAEAPTGARVLILGASGGVGTSAVQICKARGYHVIGVCSAKNQDLVTSLGADEVVDYRTKDWGHALSAAKVDAVFDFAPSGPASAESWDKAQLVLKRGGAFVTISGPDEEGRITPWGMIVLGCKMLYWKACSEFSYSIVLKKSAGAKLQELAKLAEEGKLKAVVEKVYTFDEVPSAYAHLMSGRAVGKICVSVP